MKKHIYKLFGITLSTLLLAGIFVTPTIASGGRDCDLNAVIHCGALTTTELANKLNKGTGYSNQSSTELKALFAKYGIYASDFNSLKEGRVTRDNKVYVGNTKIADNAYSMGRHKTAGSVDVPGISYPLWLRHPSESFRSDSLEAFVMLNYDGSLRYAVIKSCGNIVPGAIKVKPIEKYTLNVFKWNDMNADNHKQSNEPFLPNWQFKISGNGINKTIKTNAQGMATITGLTKGTYIVEEIQQAGWKAVTSPKRTVTVSSNTNIYFGNVKIAPQTIGLTIVKFNDSNASKTEDLGEVRLAGWQFKVTGNGKTYNLTTGADGTVSLSGLSAGTYTVTEINQAGWENTTGLTIARKITSDPSTQTFVFGNRRPGLPVPVTKNESLPVSGPIEAAAATLSGLSITAVSWIRSKKRLLDTLKKK